MHPEVSLMQSLQKQLTLLNFMMVLEGYACQCSSSSLFLLFSHVVYLAFFYCDLKSQAGIMGRGLKGDEYYYDIKAFLPFNVCHRHHFYFFIFTCPYGYTRAGPLLISVSHLVDNDCLKSKIKLQ